MSKERILFSKRNNLIPEKAIQLEGIDISLKNRLFNYLMSVVDDYDCSEFLDKVGEKQIAADDFFPDATPNKDKVFKILETAQWFVIYDFIEFVYSTSFKGYTKKINQILEEEKSGYRFINRHIVDITNKLELDEILKAQKTSYRAVKEHLEKALLLYSDRKTPDYANSIKESISAVEAMCCTILGGKSTLGQALKKLEGKGIKIHEAQKTAFSALYGYTNDEAGIRHGSMNTANAQPEDAKFMLITCSAFVNYLKEKYSKA